MLPVDRAIAARDGETCFYCNDPFIDEKPRTREHLVAVTAGGPNHITNLFHACQPCNREMGHLSAPEKIRLRDQKREARNGNS
jgi:5-methylcytosine-specific restriction endonuclease McrA